SNELLIYLLKKGADSTKIDAYKKDIFPIIHQHKYLADLLSNADKAHWLKHTILKGMCGVLNIFLKWDFDVNVIDENADNLLTITMDNFNKYVKDYNTYGRYEEIVKSLLNKNIDINYANNNGDIALNIAVRNECPRKIILSLLEKQPNTNIINKDGSTALKEAIKLLNFENIIDLIKYGAEFNESLKKDLINKTSEKLVESLLDAAKDPGFDIYNDFANFLVNKNDIESFKILLQVNKQKLFHNAINTNFDYYEDYYLAKSLVSSVKDNKSEFAKLLLPYLALALNVQSKEIIFNKRIGSVFSKKSMKLCEKLFENNKNSLVELILEYIPEKIFKELAQTFINYAFKNNNLELFKAYCKKIQAYNFEISKDQICNILSSILQHLQDGIIFNKEPYYTDTEIEKLKICLISNIFTLEDLETKVGFYSYSPTLNHLNHAFIDYIHIFKVLSDKASLVTDSAEKELSHIQGNFFSKVSNFINIYKACREVLEDKGDKENLVKLINSEQDLDFIAAITKKFFENNFFKYSPKDIESYINKLRISDNHKNENQFKLLQKDKEINEFNAMLIQIKKDLYKQIEVTKGCLYSLENLIIDNICPEFSEIITYNTLMKNQQKLEFLDEVPNWPEPRKPLFNNSGNILDLVVHKQNSADKYDFKGEILGQGDILRKFLEKLKPNIGDNEEGVLRILLPDVWDNFTKLYIEIKEDLPIGIIRKVNCFVRSCILEGYEIDMENPVDYTTMDVSENYLNPMEIEDTHGVMG
ncbi:MAG: hypothetical protein K0R02_1198, partial [Rickettsiaceae bacterium]|nr:hypothetical protein [Rickettsiaceae bacterium]